MTTEFYLDKELKVYLENDKGELWQIAVTAVPSFSQSVNQEPVSTPSLYAGGTTRNSLNKFTKNIKVGYAPGEWSFSTYVRPFNQDSKERAVEDVLWESFAQGSATAYADSPSSVSATKQDITLSKDELLSSFNLYFIYENNTGYVMKNCVVSSANTTVDIGSLATISWSGSGTSLEKFDPQDSLLSVDNLPTGDTANDVNTWQTSIIDGNTAVLTFPYEWNTNTYPFQGKAYVYNTDDGGSTWYLRQTIAAPTPQSYLFFGSSLALEGDRLIIGAQNRLHGDGGFYYYTRSAGVWSFVAAYSSSDFNEDEGSDGSSTIAGDDDRLGSAADLSGDYLATGVIGHDSSSEVNDSIGAIVMWKLVNNAWVQKEILENPDSTSGAFGYRCSVMGDRMVTASRSHLYMYTTSDSGENWTLEQSISMLGGQGGSNPLSTSRNIVQYHNQGGSYGTIVLSENYYDIPDYDSSQDEGRIRIFEHNGTSWYESQAIINPIAVPSNRALFGTAMSFDGTTIVAADVDWTQTNALKWGGCGFVHQFNHDGTSWKLTNTLDAAKSLGLEGGWKFLSRDVSVNGTNIIAWSGQPTLDNTLSTQTREIASISSTQIILTTGEFVRDRAFFFRNGQRYYVDEVSGGKTLNVSTNPITVGEDQINPTTLGFTAGDTITFTYPLPSAAHFFKATPHPSMCENSVGVAKTDNYIINKLSSLQLGSMPEQHLYPTEGQFGAGNYDYFGSTIAMQYPWLMVGQGGNAVGLDNQGTVEVYKYNEKAREWEYKQQLTPHNPETHAYFGGYDDGTGISISPDGGTCAIGSPSYGGSNAIGAVYIFTRIGDTWRQEAWIEPTGLVAGDTITWFGQHVSVYKDFLVVGAWRDGSSDGVGSAAIYKRVGSKWTKKKHLIAQDHGASAGTYHFGRGVSVYENTIVISAAKENSHGTLYFFTTTDGGETWSLSQRLVLPGSSNFGQGGRTLKLEKDILVVGEHLSNSSRGVVNILKPTSVGVYAYQTTVFPHNLDLSELENGDYFGLQIDVDTSENGKNITIASGGRKFDTNGIEEAGIAYIWESADYGINWTEGHSCAHDNIQAGDNFGYSAATSNGYTAFGAKTGNIPGSSLVDPGYVATYRKGVNFPITSANIQISNSLTPISYPLLGEMDKPIGFSSGAQQVSGSFSGYIMDDGGLDTKEFISSLFDNTIQTLPISLNLGGTKANTNRLKFELNKATLSNPSISGDGISAFSVEFSAEDTQAQNSDSTDILKITYKSSSVA